MSSNRAVRAAALAAPSPDLLAAEAGEIVLSNVFMTVSFDRRELVVEHVMHRHVYGAALRDGLNAGLELLARHRAAKWLSDDRLNGPFSTEDCEWLASEWEPRAIQAGWRYWAVVQPSNVLGQMNMRRHVDRIARLGVTLRVFDHPDAARRWIHGCP